MPGARLTHQDRQDIAEGLAEGRSYAEIAQLLGRPTSTITREVARNGGARGYRPNSAQLATVRRARRRPVHRLPPQTQDSAEVLAFQQRFTETLVRNGVPRMMARVMTCLYCTDSGSLTAAELAGRLGVSPASVSTAVRFLEEQEMITRERDGRTRRDRYLIGGDVWYRTMVTGAQLNGELGEVARQGARLLGADTPAGWRFHCAGEYLAEVQELLSRTAEEWRQVLPARWAAGPTP